MNFRRIVLLLLFVIAFEGVFAQAGNWYGNEAGDPALAGQYLQWAERAIAAGRWPQVLEALERASDFSGVSSDVSYLLALARSHEGGGRGAVLEVLARAIATGRWSHYSEASARLLEADQLIALRRYSSALTVLARAGENADAAVLRLAAFRGLAGSSPSAPPEAAGTFRRQMLDAMDRYPRDSRLFRLLFEYARRRAPDENDRALVELALRRLSSLLETDPELAWMAAPFVQNREDAARMVSAYRAGGIAPAGKAHFRPNPASIVPALELGLISEENAAKELFGSQVAPNAVAPNGITIDRALILEAGALIQGAAGQAVFQEKLLSFTGTITADDDNDGYPESQARYRDGMLQACFNDADQDGIADFSMFFAGGSPQWAEQKTGGLLSFPARHDEQSKVLVVWERYPAVQQVTLDNVAYIPAPGNLQFAPVRIAELSGGGQAGILWPQWDSSTPQINQRTLAALAVEIQRPSADFPGATERVYLKQGVPYRAEEIFNGNVVSETVFENGWPVIQRLDLDLDSKMETVRRFRRPAEAGSGGAESLQYRQYIESMERDMNGDGDFEYAELYLPDGSVVYSWDTDGDGIRDYSETKQENGKQP